MRPESQKLSGSFWVVPSACGVAAVLVAYGVARLDRLIGDAASAFLFPGPPEGARSLLGAVIGAMISFTGLVFSITVVVLVLTSGQFSPRVLRQFLRDRVIQWSLGLYVATFLYAVTTLREVLGTDGSPDSFVPRVSITLAFVLVLLSVAVFIYYIHHVVHMIQASSIIESIGAETRSLLETRYPEEPPAAVDEPVPAGHSTDVVAPRSGVVVCVDESALVRRAARDGVTVELVPRVGDFVAVGAPLMTVHGEPVDDGGHRAYRSTVAQGNERTMDQDVAFGFRQLVDIGTKALSPSVNDPTTACQVVDVLHDLLRRLATRPIRLAHHADTDGVPRLSIPGYGFDDILQVSLAEIWHFGSGSTQIPERLTGLLDDLDTAARPEHRPAIQKWSATVRTG